MTARVSAMMNAEPQTSKTARGGFSPSLMITVCPRRSEDKHQEMMKLGDVSINTYERCGQVSDCFDHSLMNVAVPTAVAAIGIHAMAAHAISVGTSGHTI